MLHIDFETRSRVNLLTAGGSRYARDPSTQVLMMSWAFYDDPVQLWLPGVNDFPGDVEHYLFNGGDVAAFNAGFEWDIWEGVMLRDFDVPAVEPEQWYCVAAQARASNLPGNLQDCARILGGPHQKDHRGAALIRLFCIPDKVTGEFNDAESHPVEWAEFCQYGIDDTYAERDVHQKMRPLTQAEREDYLVCEIINRRGMRIDRAMAQAAVQYAEAEQAELVGHITKLTNGQVTKARGQKLTQWVYESLTPDQQRHMHTYKDDVQKVTFDKNARQRLLEEPELPDIVVQVVEASDDAQAASTAKFAAMVERADVDDDRVRGSYIFNGASASGRYSARGLQPHNMPRKAVKDIATTRELMLQGASPDTLCDATGSNIMQTLKGLLRAGIVAAPGKTFVCGDWEQIEGRVCPWLAQGITPRVDELVAAKLAIYADPNRDTYLETASDILHEPITDRADSRRQAYGKVPELSLQFGGGVGALLGMARNYGVSFSETEAKQIVDNWRNANQWAPVLWNALFDAAVNACRQPMTEFTAGRITYLFQPDHNYGTLWCLLPSGRMLSYPGARCEWGENRWGKVGWQLSAMKAAWKPKQGETEWPRNSLWPGLLCENVTQASAADVLRECLHSAVVDLDWPVVGHTHDEMLLEVWEKDAKFFAEQLDIHMTAGTDWCEGLPLAAEIWVNPWFRK